VHQREALRFEPLAHGLDARACDFTREAQRLPAIAREGERAGERRPRRAKPALSDNCSAPEGKSSNLFL
jgi:hypothetical protein